MFTGIVQALGRVAVIDPAPDSGGGRRLQIADHGFTDLALGESISVNGCCLTVVGEPGGQLAFDVGPETLSRTTLGDLTSGSPVNLERALAVGDRLGGHFVTGHIDGVGLVDRRIDHGDWSTFWFACDPALLAQMVSKGSIAIDGVSLTLIEVDAQRFSVQLIPHTLAATTLGARQPGSRVNLETDLLAKHVQKLLAVAARGS